MMKRLFAIVLMVLPVAVMAQIQFGYLSYKEVMQQMPEYTKAQQDLDLLKQKYEQEALRGEEDFQRKFVEFLQGQKDFPQTIMQKRQAELQHLMDNGVNFRVQVVKLLEQAEKDLMAEVEKKLNHVILEIGIEQGYGFILNTDGHSCPYVNPVVGVDVTSIALQKLGLAPAQQTPASNAPLEIKPAPVQQPTQPVVPVQPVVPQKNDAPVQQ
ncbi:MAG: OmpH family outer membrane protein [Bacteroidaceae bacterium]|nr:OmpH family outer membrane protein [Bacteroidaceae bacterium]MBR2946916.1 OmpH family outer membrane protein [Bacteroidaceae bacterium]MDO5488831.1 OmpH family outer membrane protein [Bacteroidaceae bacterium]